MLNKKNNHWVNPLGKTILLVVAAVLLISATSCDQIATRAMIKTAVEFYNKEAYSKACPLFKKASELRPDDLKLKQSLGFCYMAQFQPDDNSPENQELVDKAAAIFLELINKMPNNKLPEESLISLYLNSNRYDEASKYLQQRLQKNPKDTETIKQIASIYLRKDDLETAFQWYMKWAEVDPKSPMPYYSICSHCWRKAYCEVNRCEDPNLAIEQRQQYIMRGLEACQKAIEIDPKHAESLAYINLIYRAKAKWVDYGNPAEQQKSMDKAKEYYEMAKQILEERKKQREAEQQKQATAG
jgi:tetratricopeptide (TPR) repeat protein